MTAFAKIAAEALVPDDLTPEEEEAALAQPEPEVPHHEKPAWQRALPWALGAAGLGALGYAGWKSLQPSSPPPEPAISLSKVLEKPRELTQAAGGPVNAGLGLGAVSAAGRAGLDFGARTLRRIPGLDYSTKRVVNELQEQPDPNAKPHWVAREMGQADTTNRENLKDVRGSIDALLGKEKVDAGGGTLTTRLGPNLVDAVGGGKPDISETIARLRRMPSSGSSATIGDKTLGARQRVGLLDAEGLKGTVNPRLLADQLQRARDNVGAHTLSPGRIFERAGRAGMTGGLLGTGLGMAAEAFGKPAATEPTR